MTLYKTSFDPCSTRAKLGSRPHWYNNLKHYSLYKNTMNITNIELKNIDYCMSMVKHCNKPEKENFMNIIEPTDHANAICCSIQNTRNSVTDVHEYVLHSKKINLGLSGMGCDTMLGQCCPGVTAQINPPDWTIPGYSLDYTRV